MAYRGTLAPGEFAKMAPNHPFAGTNISIGVNRSDLVGGTNYARLPDEPVTQAIDEQAESISKDNQEHHN
jgi:hypothetical protein